MGVCPKGQELNELMETHDDMMDVAIPLLPTGLKGDYRPRTYDLPTVKVNDGFGLIRNWLVP